MLDMYSVEDYLELIKKKFQEKNNTIKRLQEENYKLKEEYNKDEEIQKMKAELDKMRSDYYRGFPISEAEQNAIEKWKKKHDLQAHGLDTLRKRVKAGGCCGGRYTYHFLPTSIGVSGTVKCHCGAEFEFQEMG